MAYGNRQGGGKPQGSSVRLTGLFKTKRNGLYVGSLNAEKIEELVVLIKKALKTEKDLTVFLWKSKYDDGPKFSVNMDLAQDRPQGGKRRRPIQEDDDTDADNEEEDDEEAAEKLKDNDPFSDD